MRREQSGVINYVRIFGEEKTIKKAVSKIQARAKAENFPWTVDMAKIQLKDFSLDFTDRTVSTADIYSLKDLGLSVTNFVTRPRHPFDFNLDFAVLMRCSFLAIKSAPFRSAYPPRHIGYRCG